MMMKRCDFSTISNEALGLLSVGVERACPSGCSLTGDFERSISEIATALVHQW